MDYWGGGGGKGYVGPPPKLLGRVGAAGPPFPLPTPMRGKRCRATQTGTERLYRSNKNIVICKS